MTRCGRPEPSAQGYFVLQSAHEMQPSSFGLGDVAGAGGHLVKPLWA